MEEPPRSAPSLLPRRRTTDLRADAQLNRPAPHRRKGGVSRSTAVQRVCRRDSPPRSHPSDPPTGGMQIVSSTTRTAAWRLLTPLIVLALLASAFYVAQGVASADDSPGFSLDETYINYAAPNAERQTSGKEVKGKNGIFAPKGTSAVEKAQALDRKFAGGNPRDARQLAKLEAKAIKERKNPRQIKQAKGMQEARLLTILVEFNDDANDDFTGLDGPGDRLREPRRACRAPSRTGRCTTTSRTRRRSPTRTTTRCGCRTSRRSTSTRCSTPTRASPSASAPT